MGILRSTPLLLLGLAVALCLPTAAPASDYEDRLKQLAEAVTADAVKAKAQRLAVLDFTDAKGRPSPVGEFLAEELGTQLLVAGELTVVEPKLVRSTLKKFHIDDLASSRAKAVRRAARAMRADMLLTGSYVNVSDGLAITVKLVSPSTVQVVGAARGTVPATGPLAELMKEPVAPAPAVIEGPKNAPLSRGLGQHRNELYELTVESLTRTTESVTLAATIENRSSRGVKILCHLQDTVLKDDHGAAWTQAIDDNRDGLCMRGLEIAAGDKGHAVVTFTGPAGTAPAEFTLFFHEKSPRRDATYTIGQLKADTRAAGLPSTQ
jgi:TolB-like protein